MLAFVAGGISLRRVGQVELKRAQPKRLKCLDCVSLNQDVCRLGGLWPDELLADIVIT